jgi:hypothetical protein
MGGKRLVHAITPVLLFIATATTATAELQNATIEGEIRIRGQVWESVFNNAAVFPTFVTPQIRWPGFFLPARPIGDIIGGQSAASFYDWDSRGPDYSVVEQRTDLSVNFDFTDRVRAFVELSSFDVWGEDFRSNYVTGADRPANSVDDVEIYQSYIEASEMWGTPLQLRIGRQEITIADGWLVGDNSAIPEFVGLSFDAVRLDYRTDDFQVGAFWSKLNEVFAVEEDGDTDFSGAYASYSGIEHLTLDAYWLWLRDAGSVNDTNGTWLPEWIEGWLGLDDYDPTSLHTFALRAAGEFGPVDFNANAAYQFGDADRVGALFRNGTYGDDGAEYDAWAADAEVGYTFDVRWTPRVYAGAAYIGGEDNRDISFVEWLNPFDRPEASVSFNRLFSNRVYSYFFDEIAQMSNFWSARAGVSATPLERVDAGLNVAYFEALEPFDLPRYIALGRYRVPLNPQWSFWTTSSDDSLGWQTDLWVTYRYSDALTFKAGWSHLFGGDGLEDGNYTDYNGLSFNGGTASEDADYLYAETTLSF